MHSDFTSANFGITYICHNKREIITSVRNISCRWMVFEKHNIMKTITQQKEYENWYCWMYGRKSSNNWWYTLKLNTQRYFIFKFEYFKFNNEYNLWIFFQRDIKMFAEWWRKRKIISKLQICKFYLSKMIKNFFAETFKNFLKCSQFFWGIEFNKCRSFSSFKNGSYDHLLYRNVSHTEINSHI